MKRTEGKMRDFGPFYPPSLQQAIIHAERLSGILARLPVAGAEDADAAWIVGRVDEIACFVRAVARDWRSGGLAETCAAGAIGAYVDVLHAGLAHRLGVETLACCSLPDATVRPVTCDASTVVAPVLWSRRHPLDTIPSASTLLAALDQTDRRVV